MKKVLATMAILAALVSGAHAGSRDLIAEVLIPNPTAGMPAGWIHTMLMIKNKTPNAYRYIVWNCALYRDGGFAGNVDVMTDTGTPANAEGLEEVAFVAPTPFHSSICYPTRTEVNESGVPPTHSLDGRKILNLR